MENGGISYKIDYGEAVGILAAQSVGEPASQTLLKNIHLAGSESGLARAGLKRIERILEARKARRIITKIYLDPAIERNRKEVVKIAQKVAKVAELSNTKNCKQIGILRKEIEEYEADGTPKDNPAKKYTIGTIGCLIGMLNGIEGIDHARTYSSDIHTVCERLGIEAARNEIIKNLEYAFEKHEISVDRRHLMLIADAMTWSGKLEGVGLNGLIMRKSALGRAADHAANRYLSGASIRGELSETKGAAESVMMGKRMLLGTGSVKLSIDTELLGMRQKFASKPAEIEFGHGKDWNPVYGTSYMKVGKNLGCRDPTGFYYFRDLKLNAKIMPEWNVLARPVGKGERNFFNANNILRTMCSSLDVPDSMKEEIARVYRRCLRKRITNGRLTEAMALAVILIKCREHGIIRDISGVMDSFNLRQGQVDSCIEAINSEFMKGGRHEALRASLAKALGIINADKKFRNRASRKMAQTNGIAAG